MKELLIPLGVLVAWFVLNKWMLPRFGVKTCPTSSRAYVARDLRTVGYEETKRKR